MWLEIRIFSHCQKTIEREGNYADVALIKTQSRREWLRKFEIGTTCCYQSTCCFQHSHVNYKIKALEMSGGGCQIHICILTYFNNTSGLSHFPTSRVAFSSVFLILFHLKAKNKRINVVVFKFMFFFVSVGWRLKLPDPVL